VELVRESYQVPAVLGRRRANRGEPGPLAVSAGTGVGTLELWLGHPETRFAAKLLLDPEATAAGELAREQRAA
jgi:hypothetical protein